MHLIESDRICDRCRDECAPFALLPISVHHTGDVLGYPRNRAALLQLPPRQRCGGDPSSAGQERYCTSAYVCVYTILHLFCQLACAPAHFECSSKSRWKCQTWCSLRRCVDPGEDPDQSEQRSETSDCQDFWGDNAKGKEHKRTEWVYSKIWKFRSAASKQADNTGCNPSVCSSVTSKCLLIKCYLH